MFGEEEHRFSNIEELINGDVIEIDYIKTNRLKAISSVQKSVKTLMDNGVVDNEADLYFISDPFFKLYIEQQL